MKVKINNELYDSNEDPIMIILNDKEKDQISNMGAAHKYASFPDDIGWSVEEMKDWMNDKI